MGAAGAYFRHIREAVATIFDGMAVTASHFIRKPYTVQYPDRMSVRVQDTLPFRYRGILDVDLEICTGCLACDRACPIDCIAIAIEKNAQTREIVISQFDIDISKCMFCGLCSEPCPTGAIHHTTEFEGADYALESLIRRFIAEPMVAYKPKKGAEPDAQLGKLLERGMTYVDEWAQPGSDKPPATAAKPASPAAASRPVPAAAKTVAQAASAEAVPAKPAPTAGAAAAPGADETPVQSALAPAARPPSAVSADAPAQTPAPSPPVSNAALDAAADGKAAAADAPAENASGPASDPSKGGGGSGTA
ncbi:MAG: 4Fe-4S binding protein [Candidatus Binataceae bacterium]